MQILMQQILDGDSTFLASFQGMSLLVALRPYFK